MWCRSGENIQATKRIARLVATDDQVFKYFSCSLGLVTLGHSTSTIFI